MRISISRVISGILCTLLLAGCAKEVMNPQGEYGFESQDFTAIVTVHKSPTDTIYFQVDDTTRLFPTNYYGTYTGLERIVCGITVFKEIVPNYGYRTSVDWFDQLDKGTFTTSKPAGSNDGLDILSDWMTSCEDGFLTLHYSTWWGDGSVQHDFTLVSGQNPSDPYEVLLVQNANGDGREGGKGDSIVYFDINSLPDTGDSYKTLTLKWTDSGGKAAEKEFRFKTRRP